jgi:hypothetical protein
MMLLSKINPYKFIVIIGGIILFLILYPSLFLHPNDLFIASEGDSLKNYYTYAYQIKHGDDLFNFNGLNYPYGEQITFTDGQPLLTLFLSFFPFLEGHSIGIMNFLIMLSFSLTPLIIYKVFRKFNLPEIQSIVGALSIALMCPQIFRLSGHFSLTYPIIFPLLILLLLNFCHQPSFKNSFKIFLLSFCAFMLHPYTGFAFTMFSSLALVIFYFSKKSISVNKNFTFYLSILLSSIGAILVFKGLLWSTDVHGLRYDTPYGYDLYSASPGSVFVPSVGPFRHFLSQVIKVYAQEWESLGYIGICTIFTLVITIVLKTIFVKRFCLPEYTLLLFIPAIFTLLFSFGLHLKFGDTFANLLGPIKQFRALGRFSWLFYFVSTIFAFILVDKISRAFFLKRGKQIALVLTLVFGVLFTIESMPFHNQLKEFVGKSKNSFLTHNLKPNILSIVNCIKTKKYQSIITLPYFHVGSEFFTRNPSRESYVPAMLISYHTGIPLMGNIGSRTAIEEAKNEISLLNQFTDKTEIRKASNSNLPIAVIVTDGTLLYDEELFLQKCKLIDSFGDIKLYETNWDKICERKLLDKYSKEKYSEKNSRFSTDSTKFIYKNKWDVKGVQKPYLEGIPSYFTNALEIKAGELPLGDYVFSCKYYYDENADKINTNLICEKIINGEDSWPIMENVKAQSGIFQNFIVFETNVHIDDANATYGFKFHGYPTDVVFRASNVLLRKKESTILETNEKGEVIGINNYPVSVAYSK